jgi:hypothetical protein
VQGYEVIYGVKNLRDYLKKNKDVYVKLNKFRATAESFHSPDYLSVEQKLNVLESALGPHANDDSEQGFPFVVEKAIKADCELGFDGFVNGSGYGSHAFVGYEWHKSIYLAKVYPTDELPDPIMETMDHFYELFKSLDYRGAVSTEELLIDKQKHAFLDICGRLPAPLSALYPQYIEDYPQMIYNIGKNEPFEMNVKTPFVCAIPFNSEELRTNYMKINIKDREKVKLQMGCGDKAGNLYGVKGLETACIAIGGGETYEEAIDDAVKNADLVDAIDINKDCLKGVKEVFEELVEKGKSVGIDFN